MTRHTGLLALATVLALSACQTDKPQTAARGDNRAAIKLMQTVNENAQKCWVKSKDKAFRNYRVIPELDTRVGKPRILIMQARASQGLPQLVIEADGTPPRLSSYGPLTSDALSARINEDVTRWASGNGNCTA